MDAHAPTQLGDEPPPLAPAGSVCRPGQVYAGEYLVRDLLGAGGMGEVYLVEHQTLKAPFALKVLRPHLRARADLVTRFRAESRALWELSHPSFVQVHHAGEDPIIGPYIVMEVLRGKSLSQLLAVMPQLEIERALGLAADVADAAELMHQKGIIHRDLKPENIFLHSPPSGSLCVKLLDLGAAKIEKYGGPVTAEHKAIGTGRYMSPEQIRGQPLSPATDVYALGHILYEMVAGCHAFAHAAEDRPGHVEFQIWHLNAAPAPLAQRVPGAPAELSALLDQALQKAPERRFTSMAALSAALREVLRLHRMRASVGGTRPMATPTPDVDPIQAVLLGPSPDGSWGIAAQRRSDPPRNGTATAEIMTARDPLSRGLVLGAQGAVGPLTERSAGAASSRVPSPIGGTARLEDAVQPNVLAHLVVVEGELAGRAFPLAPRTYRVGRDADVDIYVADPSLSLRHARLVVNPTSVVEVFDEQSTNGTTLNGTPVPYAVVRHGDRLRFGRVLCELRLVHPQSAMPPSGTMRMDIAPGELAQGAPKTLAAGTPTPAPPAAPLALRPQALREDHAPRPSPSAAPGKPGGGRTGLWLLILVLGAVVAALAVALLRQAGVFDLG